MNAGFGLMMQNNDVCTRKHSKSDQQYYYNTLCLNCLHNRLKQTFHIALILQLLNINFLKVPG